MGSDEFVFEEYLEEEDTGLTATIEMDSELLEKDIKEYLKNNIKKYMKVTY